MSWGTLLGEEKIDIENETEIREHPPGMRFLDLNAVVTGGGSGLGADIAIALAKEGANVVVTYNTSKESAEETAKKIASMGRKSAARKLDITKWQEVKDLADSLWKDFGPIDVLINCAGDMVNKQMSWKDITEESIDHALSVDIKGPLFMIQEFGRRMFENKTGSIVNISSHVVVLGSPRAPQYAAGKEGLIGLTKSYALAFAPWVRINAAGPGYIETDALKKRKDWTPERRQFVLNNTPLRRLAKERHIVPLVLFLASDDAIHMTGNLVIADGGYTMPGA